MMWVCPSSGSTSQTSRGEGANGRQRAALRVQLPKMPNSGDGHSSGSRTPRLGGRLNIDTSKSMVMSVLLARVEACRRPGAQRVTPRHYHRHVPMHTDAHPLVGFGMRQHARTESISKRPPSVLTGAGRFESSESACTGVAATRPGSRFRESFPKERASSTLNAHRQQRGGNRVQRGRDGLHSGRIGRRGRAG